MNLPKTVHKNILLFILIFLVGIIGFVVYINGSFNEKGNHTFTKQPTEKVSYRS